MIFSKARHALPPGPPEHPVLGSVLSLGKKPLKFFQTLLSYGDIASFRLLHQQCYFVNTPESVHRVLHNPNLYTKDTVDFLIFRRVLGDGLVSSQGDFWLRQRRLVQPSLHRKQVSHFARVMIETTEEMLGGWRKREGAQMDMWEEMRHLAVRIAGKALFSVDLDDPELVEPFYGLERYIVDLFSIPLLLPLWVPIPANRRLVASQKALDRMVYTMTSERRQHRHDEETPKDLLSMLLAVQDEDGSFMTDEQIRTEIITLLFAGHETTAATLTWIWYLLALHPEVEQKLHEELDRVLEGRLPQPADLPRLHYTKMIVDEVLRLWPPAFMTNRRVKQDDEFEGYPVKKGSLIFVSPLTMHRRTDLWPEPERFDPSRFLPERLEARPRYSYFPFGGGPHICIGNTFALTEAQLVTATIASRYRLKIVEGYDIQPDLLPSLRPTNLYMTLVPR